jgi:hypothetical protein
LAIKADFFFHLPQLRPRSFIRSRAVFDNRAALGGRILLPGSRQPQRKMLRDFIERLHKHQITLFDRQLGRRHRTRQIV